MTQTKLRQQIHDVADATPIVLGAAGLPAPARLDSIAMARR
jgi:arylsulfatase A-like enzyme